MNRYIVIVEGVAGWLECTAESIQAARVYAAERLGLRRLPARHCCARIA